MYSSGSGFIISNLVIGLLMSFIFLVYSSILTSRLVIREYEQKTITILFSYPLNRRQLIISKLVIIMAYTAISMTVGYICCSVYIILADRYFDMLAGSFALSFLQKWIPMALITVAVCTILSLWPFIIGMIHKSVPATVVTSLIVIVLRQLQKSSQSGVPAAGPPCCFSYIYLFFPHIQKESN